MNNLNQEQLQHLHKFRVLDFDQDDLQHSLEQQEQEVCQQAETEVQAIPRNDQEVVADPLSLIPQFQEFNCKCHHENQPRKPMKRPLPPSLLDQQMAKKLQLLQSQGSNHSLHGFAKLALPLQHNQTPPFRAASAPTFSFNNYNHSLDAVSGPNANANANSPVSPKQVGVKPTTPSPVKGSPSLVSRRGGDSGSVTPPLPPTIRRTVSDPSPLSSGGTSVDESPLSERLRMMKHDLKQMSHWCDQVIRGEEEERKAVNEEKIKAIKDHKTESETQEAVNVEVIGDCLSLHFNCPCGKGYEILLTGNNCYYKLV